MPALGETDFECGTMLHRCIEMSLFAELKRRNVFRMAGLYLVGAWLVVQVAGTVLPMFGAPEWLPRTSSFCWRSRSFPR